MKETLPVLYRDEHLIAIHKPSGLLVHRTVLDRHETRFVVQILRDQIRQYVHPVHRLDRGTSGVLVFALDRNIGRLLSAQFEAEQIDKTYLAIVRGHPDKSGCIAHPLTRQYDDYEFHPSDDSSKAQNAVTNYRRLAITELPCAVDRYQSSRYALLELTPQTGRRHQIRRHLKHIAHPIIGDATYGKGLHNRFFQEHFGCHRMLLACTQMKITHPISGERLYLSAPLTGDFATVISALGWDLHLQDRA